jgi:ABC-type transport system involved in multi-copper enzyme maturation permease subunit
MSPIHDQTYRRYLGTRLPVGRTWTVIAGEGIRAMMAKRAFLILLIVAWIPFVVRAVQIYIGANYPQAGAFVSVDPRTFRDFLDQQGAFIFFVTIYVGSGLIASDRRANALQIYLSKPLLRAEYIVGKLLILVSFLLSITLLPAVLLILLQVAFAGNVDFLKNNFYVVPAIVLASLVKVLVASFTMLALSSLSKSSRYVSLLYTGAIFFTEAMFNALRVITGSTRVAWISITANLKQVTDAMFRQPTEYETPIIVCVLVLLALVVVSISVLERRVKGVEVVS